MEGFFCLNGKKAHFPLMHILCRNLNGGNTFFSADAQMGRVLPQWEITRSPV